MTKHGFGTALVDEGLRKRFEKAWQIGQPMSIDDCLPPTSHPQHLSTLEELVHIELECAWKNWSESRPPRDSAPLPACVEDYLGRFPALNQPPIVLRLVRQEYFVRNRWGDKPSSDEYQRRFPSHIRSEEDLQTRSAQESTVPGRDTSDSSGFDVVAVGTDGVPRGHLRVQCPHCRSSIELDYDAPLREIACPSCGSAFSLVSETETVSRQSKQHTLGHFELLDHLGMGQFGNVWRAHDKTLDRIVALKIPRREHLDQELFFREARAAAQLQHPNIVSVHEIGREDETVYIACDFVQGANLQEWLGTKQLGFRQAAQLCLTVAEALQHAHESGVVHRDLKPSNIMIDAEGQPHLMDFGLAKRESGEITMTVRGQVLGTPAYMSPEQARGEGHEADRRADVYSLGVVLYQLLTGELPFRGERRMLIVQILSDDPAPPRRLNGRVPRDLETICLKCLEKQPDRRYQTAADLASDLLAWLDRRAIQARAIGRFSRAVRWCQRRPAVASLLGLVLLVSLVGFALVAWQWRRANVRFVDLTREREYSKALIEVVGRMLVQAGAERLQDDPQMELTRRKLIEEALNYYDYLAQREEDDLSIRRYLVLALARAGELRLWLGDYQAAIEALERSNALLSQLQGTEVNISRPDVQTAKNHHNLGKAYVAVDQAANAERQFRKAVSMWRQEIKEDPANADLKRQLAESLNEWAGFLDGQSKNEEAEDVCSEAIALLKTLAAETNEPDLQWDLARGYHRLANLLAHTPRQEETEHAFEQARQLFEAVGSRGPLETSQQANFLHDIAIFWWNNGKRAEADEVRLQALALRKQLTDGFPAVPKYRYLLALGHQNVGWSHWGQERLDDARNSFQQSIRIFEALVDEYSDVADYRKSLAGTNNLLGGILTQLENPDEAHQAYDRAASVWREILKKNPKDMEAHHELGGVLSNTADLYRRFQKEYPRALVCLDEAIEHQLIAHNSDKQNTKYARYLSNHYLIQARIHKVVGEFDRAGQRYEQASSLARKLYQDVPDDRNKQGHAGILFEIASFLVDAEDSTPSDHKHALKLAEESVSLLPDKHGSLNNRRAWVTFATACHRCGESQRAADILKDMLGDEELQTDTRCCATAYLAMSYAQLKQLDAARQHLDLGRQLAAELELEPGSSYHEKLYRRLLDEAEQQLMAHEEPK